MEFLDNIVQKVIDNIWEKRAQLFLRDTESPFDIVNIWVQMLSILPLLKILKAFYFHRTKEG